MMDDLVSFFLRGFFQLVVRDGPNMHVKCLMRGVRNISASQNEARQSMHAAGRADKQLHLHMMGPAVAAQGEESQQKQQTW